ncbi:hypothetical protein BDV93DRAFT_525452 [Ceratobasidium sp. AG-I]|nr:hypothetical protein BDV93DRAFT_525452 [Ceratobasidium sp. AG-I]
MATIPDGTYCIELPMGGPSITDSGEGRYLNLLPQGSLGPDAHKINIVYNSSQGAYAFKFAASGKCLTFLGEPGMNNKLVTGDKPRYFKISKHEYEQDKYTISVAEGKEFHIGMALERIFPPWVAMLSFPEKQAWSFKKL